MESSEHKFKRSSQQFRNNMEKIQQSQRRTIFLHEDDVPSTSKKGACTKTRKRAAKNMSGKPTTPRTTTARHCQMTVDTPEVPTGTQPQKQNHRKFSGLPNKTSKLCTESISLSSDEETPPPPPPYIDPAVMEGGIREDVVATPPPPAWDDESFDLDDLAISPEDLNDPLILEFIRSFCGATDSTVDIRPPTPPSPAKSFSSTDWENENFRPSTPPKVRRFATFDIKDAQYQYAGMHCYERVWRARILVPKAKPTLAIAGSDLESPRRPTSSNTKIPTTPGRGWLNCAEIYDSESPDCQESTTRSPSAEVDRFKTKASSSPVAISSSRRSPTPPPPPLHASRVEASWGIEQLPMQLQQEIEERRRDGTRVRLLREIDGHWYRINISRDGVIRVTSKDYKN